MSVVAEGVETPAQQDVLCEAGVTALLFLVSHPLPENELNNWLAGSLEKQNESATGSARKASYREAFVKLASLLARSSSNVLSAKSARKNLIYVP